MAQQTINIGTVANDGTGDPLRTAFDKVNDNFTELYSDDQGDVNSVSAGVGISVDQTTGAVTVTNDAPNATHTGQVTGGTALTIADDVVDYDNLNPEFKALTTDANMSYGSEAIHEATLTGTGSVLNIIGIKQGATKTAIFTGGGSLGFGGTATSTYNIIAGEYDETVSNFIQVFATGNFPNQDFYITISQPV